MKQLGGSDSVWFALETENTPMHVTNFGIYGPEPGDSRRMTLSRLRRYVAQRIGSLPLRSRLMNVPFKADYPYWIEDENFNLDDHIPQAKLPAPATWATLLETFREIVESPLDHSRPLWEMRLITGLGRMDEFPPGSFALAIKLHHGQFDGTNLRKFMFKLHTPLEQLDDGEGDSWLPDRHPSALSLLTRAAWHRYRWWWNSAAAVTKTLPGVVSHVITDAIENRGAGKKSGNARETPKSPRTRFLCNIRSRERVFDALEFPMADVKGIRKLVEGATINDVALAIAGGGVRRYLAAHGELPDEPIRFTSPVSAHQSDEAEETGNRISLMVESVYTDVADPLERLGLIYESTARAKKTSEDIGAGNIADIDRLPVEASGISLTNVPGSAEPSYLDGFRMLRSVGAGFLLDGLGLMLIATSYEKVFSLQFFTSPDIMPDPAFFRSCLEDAYAEMRDLL